LYKLWPSRGHRTIPPATTTAANPTQNHRRHGLSGAGRHRDAAATGSHHDTVSAKTAQTTAETSAACH
jgi:hypothetical protein